MLAHSLDRAADCQHFYMVKEHLNWIKRMLGVDDIDSPEEANTDVLKRMVHDGDDLTKPRDMDFNHLFANETDAVAFEQAAREAGYHKVTRDFWPEAGRWLTSVTIRMVPDLGKITSVEQILNEIAAPLEGKPDGWGCMEVIAATHASLSR